MQSADPQNLTLPTGQPLASPRDPGNADAPRIAIVGLGLLTPLGHSPWQTMTALASGRILPDRAAHLPPDVDPIDMVRVLGTVSVGVHGATDPAVELAERAARQALTEARIDSTGLPCVLGTSKGAVHVLQAAAAQLREPGRQQPNQGWAVYHNQRFKIPLPAPADAALAVGLGPVGYLGHHVARRLQLGDITHFVAACASGLFAVHQARQRMLRDRQLKHMLVVSADATLLPMFIHSYRRLGVLAPLTDRDSYRSLPLDRRRAGFMLAEAGAAVVLQRIEPGEPMPLGSVELIDTAVASEANDLIRPAAGMPALEHVARQMFAHGPIDLLHPHAPGTGDHDQQEIAIYRQLLGTLPDVYACKGALGHNLGAAGLVALVMACVCARAGQRPPMLWLKQPVDGLDESYRRQRAPARTLRRHAIFAAGFGGHVAGALIERV